MFPFFNQAQRRNGIADERTRLAKRVWLFDCVPKRTLAGFANTRPERLLD
jgi:hypothetical protein